MEIKKESMAEDRDVSNRESKLLRLALPCLVQRYLERNGPETVDGLRLDDGVPDACKSSEWAEGQCDAGVGSCQGPAED